MANPPRRAPQPAQPKPPGTGIRKGAGWQKPVAPPKQQMRPSGLPKPSGPPPKKSE